MKYNMLSTYAHITSKPFRITAAINARLQGLFLGFLSVSTKTGIIIHKTTTPLLKTAGVHKKTPPGKDSGGRSQVTGRKKSELFWHWTVHIAVGTFTFGEHLYKRYRHNFL